MDTTPEYITVETAAGTTTFPAGVSVSEVLSASREALAESPDTMSSPPLAALVNNEVRALSYHLHINGQVHPIFLESTEGQRVYRRSVSFLTAMAAHQLFPGRRLLIGHSLGNAYYYSFADGPVTPEDLARLKEEMLRYVGENLRISRGVAAYDDALQYFREHAMEGAALLVERHNSSEIAVYRCAGYMDLSHGPLVAETAMLQWWDLEIFEEGFLLLVPDRTNPRTVVRESRSSTIFGIYREYKGWGRILGISTVGQLNKVSEAGEIRSFIRIAETLHDKKIANIADQILASGASEKVVLVAGPSSSGKTTFSKRLAVQLQVLGMTPLVIGLDDYFVPRERTPRDADGNYDFESVNAIDIEALNNDLLALFSGNEVPVRRFNFKTGTPEFPGAAVRLPHRGVLLMEGIHGLNPALTPRIPQDRTFRIYVSALTQLNLDDHNRIATTDNRLIRRMVRDHQFRGNDAAATLAMWPSVRRGEDHNIFPFQDSANATFNTALDYELGVLRGWAEPLLRQVKPSSQFFHEAVRLQTFLRNFTSISDRYVPTDSILREFIGGSGFHY